ALRGALEDPQIEALIGELVKLEVAGDGFTIEVADPDEAAAFWEGFVPSGPQQAPRLDTSVSDLIDLADVGLQALPLIGAKAAQMGELYQVEPLASGSCAEVIPFSVPKLGFAIPVVHFLRHYEDSGAKAFLERERGRDWFATDPLRRAETL